MMADELQIADKFDRLRDALIEIETWARAYPLTVFPEPDLTKAASVLSQHGMTLDAISANAMRHVLSGIVDIVRGALDDVRDGPDVSAAG